MVTEAEEQAASRTVVLGLLDELQAAERAGADALGQWLQASGDARLRGGLRVIRGRNLAHALLAEARLLALGAAPAADAPPGLAKLCGLLAAPTLSDRSKLAILLARVPPDGRDPLGGTASVLADDPETAELLAGLRADDRANLAWLQTLGLEEPPSAVTAGEAAGRGEVVAFLDALRAAETASAAVFEAWAAATARPRLRGGLTVIAARETTHARVCAERLRDLGATPQAAVAAAVERTAVQRYGDPACADDEKLAAVLARQGDAAAAVAPLLAMAERIVDDAETCELLRLVAAGEQASARWLAAARGLRVTTGDFVAPRHDRG